MFDYTKETIINSADRFTTLPETGTPKTMFRVTKAMDYKLSSIEGSKTFRTIGVRGSFGEISFTPLVTADALSQRLRLTIRSVAEYPAELATTMGLFKKPLIVDYTAVSGDAAKTAIIIAKNINALFVTEYKPIIAIATGSTVKIKANEKFILFSDLSIDKLTLDANTGDYVESPLAIAPTIVQSVMNFGDYDYIMHNHRYPTHENTRFFSTNSDDMPEKGGLYNQYSFRYIVERTHTGMGTIGQKLTSITTHIFYVLSTLATAFEAELREGGLTISEYVAENGTYTEKVVEAPTVE